MKSILRFAFLVLLLALSFSNSIAQAIYTYTNATNGSYNFLATNLTATNLAPIGSWGTNTPCSNGGGISGITIDPSVTTYDPSISTNPALNVDVSANNGYVTTITSINVNLRRSGTGPTKAMMAYSINGGLTWLSKGVEELPNNGSCGSLSNHVWTLNSPLIVCNGLFKFRIYYYAAGASTGTIQVTNLNINGSVTSSANNITTVSDTICSGELPYIWYGQTLTGGGIGAATKTFINIAGCDSIVSLNLIVRNSMETIFRDTICHNQLPYSWNGLSLLPLGNVMDTQQVYVSTNGCDSIAKLKLYVSSAPLIVTYQPLPACGSVIFEGNTYFQSTVYHDSLSTTYGCDSAYRAINITVYPIPAISLGSDTAICPQDTITLHVGTGHHNYLWSTGESTASIRANDSGTYSVVVTSEFGCSATTTKHISWLDAATANGFNFIPQFYMDLGKVVFQPLNPQYVDSYLWEFGDGQTSTAHSPSHTFNQPGNFLVTLHVFNDCGKNSYSLPINVDLITGIEATKMSDEISIALYPNPSQEYFIIENKRNNNPIKSMQIFDMMGKMVHKAEMVTSNQSFTVNVASFASGVYSVIIRTAQGFITKKINIQR